MRDFFRFGCLVAEPCMQAAKMLLRNFLKTQPAMSQAVTPNDVADGAEGLAALRHIEVQRDGFTNGQCYARKNAGAGTTDVSQDCCGQLLFFSVVQQCCKH